MAKSKTDLVLITEEMLNGKLHFLCSEPNVTCTYFMMVGNGEYVKNIILSSL